MNLELKEKVKNFFFERFRVSKDFWRDFNLIFRGKIIWVNKFEKEIPLNKIISLGIPLLRVIRKDELKPTSWGLIFLNKQIKEKKVDLKLEELIEILERQKIKFEKKELKEGYVAISFEDKVLGCGFFKNKLLVSQIPKAKRTELLNILKKCYNKNLWK